MSSNDDWFDDYLIYKIFFEDKEEEYHRSRGGAGSGGGFLLSIIAFAIALFVLLLVR